MGFNELLSWWKHVSLFYAFQYRYSCYFRLVVVRQRCGYYICASWHCLILAGTVALSVMPMAVRTAVHGSLWRPQNIEISTKMTCSLSSLLDLSLFCWWHQLDWLSVCYIDTTNCDGELWLLQLDVEWKWNNAHGSTTNITEDTLPWRTKYSEEDPSR